MMPQGCFGDNALSVTCHGCANRYNDKECLKTRKEKQLELFWER